jgi:hypothetical protein
VYKELKYAIFLLFFILLRFRQRAFSAGAASEEGVKLLCPFVAVGVGVELGASS